MKFALGLRDSKHRRLENRFLVDGLKNIVTAVRSGIQLTEIFVSESEWERPGAEFREFLRCYGPGTHAADSRDRGCRWTRLTQVPMDKLQYGEQSSPAIAVAISPDTTLEHLSKRLSGSKPALENELYLVLDRLEKPGNLGAAMRSADAAGVTAVLLSDPMSEVWNPNAIRASLGAMFTVPLAVDTWPNLASWFGDRAVKVYAARTENGGVYSQIAFPEKTAIVIGNEAQGLEDRWSSREISSVHIPMFGKIDSLNASVTGSILLFEVIRQRLTR